MRIGPFFLVTLALFSSSAFPRTWKDFEDPSFGLRAKVLVRENLTFRDAKKECESFGAGWGLPTGDDFGSWIESNSPIHKTYADPKTDAFLVGVGYTHLKALNDRKTLYAFWTGIETQTHALLVMHSKIGNIDHFVCGITGDDFNKLNEFGVVCTYHSNRDN